MGGAGEDETLRSHRDPGASGERFAIGSIAQDRYRIERFIAAGGMGEVYAAHDLVLDTTVALKTLRPELEGSADAIARLRREIALARSVTDPHICRLHDVGEHHGRVFLTMELLEGRTLAELVGRHPLALDEVERLAPQLVAGLSALHRASIIHRDFKTSNVIVVDVGPSARAVITDFGLARSDAAGNSRLTVESGMLGTPAYMAPEQVEARPATKASDIYSLGVVLFELLTGTLPFDEDTAMATATARLTKDPPRPSSLRREIPARWDAIVLRCLARDPAARFASVDDILGHRPRSRRWFLAAGGGALAAAAAFGVSRVAGIASVAPAVARSARDLVAVLPVQGEGRWIDDPWCTALTFDIHDALATVGVPLLAIHTGAMYETAEGAASRVLEELDPVAAAFALPDVKTVVTMTLARTASAIELAVAMQGLATRQLRTSRPPDRAAALAHDVAAAIAFSLGHAAPVMPVDAWTIDAELYERYGAAMSRKYRAPTKAEVAAMKRRALATPDEQMEQLVTNAPHVVRAAKTYAEELQMDAEQLESYAEMTRLLERAERLANDVLGRDFTNGLAHAVLGHCAMLRWNWRSADEHTRRGLELAPTHERVEYHRTFYLLLDARYDEAIEIEQEAQRRNPEPRLGNARMAWWFYYARRWPELIRAVEPVLDQFDYDHQLDGILTSFLALAYAESGLYKEALATADKLKVRIKSAYALGGLVPAYVLAGRFEEARALRDHVDALAGIGRQAMMADALGETDKALAYVEQFVASHNGHALFLKVERYSGQLRARPRFQELLAQVFGGSS